MRQGYVMPDAHTLFDQLEAVVNQVPASIADEPFWQTIPAAPFHNPRGGDDGSSGSRRNKLGQLGELIDQHEHIAGPTLRRADLYEVSQ